MKNVRFRCSVCGKLNITNNDNYECSYCHEKNNKLNYLINQLKIDIINQVIDNELIESILLIDENSVLAKYYSLPKNIRLQNIDKYELKEYQDFIYHYDIINDIDKTKEEKEKIINKIKDVNIRNRYLKYLFCTSIDDISLKNDIKKIDFDMNIYEKPKKTMNRVYLVLCIIFLVISLVLSLICNSIVDSIYIYGVVIVFNFIPSLLFTIYLFKLLKMKKGYLYFIGFILIFLLLSYIMTIPYHEGNFIESIVNHFKHIINSINDLAKSISSNYGD